MKVASLQQMENRSKFIVGLSAAIVVIALVVAIVTKDDKSNGGSTTTAAATAPAGESQPVASTTTDLNKKPVIPSQKGTPPTALVTKDIVTGSGAEAKPGDKVTVKYVGVLWDGGTQFDASWDRPAPQDVFEFTIGKGEVIPGWDQGVAGMKVGGRRQLTIPADLGYGANGSPPTIPPDATLVFVVDLKKVN